MLVLAGGVGLALWWQGQWPPFAEVPEGSSGQRAASDLAPRASRASRTGAMFLPERLQDRPAGGAQLPIARVREEDGHPYFDSDEHFERARRKQVLMTEMPVQALAHRLPPEDMDRMGTPRRWIRYEPDLLAARAEGDRFILSLPGEGPVEAEIDRVDVSDGLRRWSGHMLAGTGGSFSITQSMRDQYAIGSFRVEGAEFLMEVKRGVGWVADASREFRQEAGATDTRRPPPASAPD